MLSLSHTTSTAFCARLPRPSLREIVVWGKGMTYQDIVRLDVCVHNTGLL